MILPSQTTGSPFLPKKRPRRLVHTTGASPKPLTPRPMRVSSPSNRAGVKTHTIQDSSDLCGSSPNAYPMPSKNGSRMIATVTYRYLTLKSRRSVPFIVEARLVARDGVEDHFVTKPITTGACSRSARISTVDGGVWLAGVYAEHVVAHVSRILLSRSHRTM